MEYETINAVNGVVHNGIENNEERVDVPSNCVSDVLPENILHPIVTNLEENTDLTQSSSNGTLSNGVDAQEQVSSSKKSRRVTFPENDVQSYLNPPDPWKAGKLCTSDSVVHAYTKACETFNVKPIGKLVQQLRLITNFSERNDLLSLRGEKVDYRQIESLEEIFKRVQFRTLDLENTYLDEEGAIALFDMVEYYESAIKLNISGNRTIGFRGWQACSRMLKKTPSLIHLEVRGCLLVESSMGFLSRPIRMGCFLRVLHLENTNMSGKSLIILGTALKMNDVLSELYLGENKLTASDGIQLGNIMKHNSSLSLLDVRNNSLQDVGVAHLCDGLCDQTGEKGLKTLVLFNNQLTYQAMSSLAKVLVATSHLLSLNVGHNTVTNEGIHRLKESLLVNQNLTSLALQSARISCEGAVALAEYVAESRCLQHVDLRENEIKTAGLMALALSLKVNQTVTRVDIDKEPKKEGMKDYAEQQRRLLQDIITCTMRNAELIRQQEWSEAEKRRLQALAVGGADDTTLSPTAPQGRFFGGVGEGNGQRLLEEEVEAVLHADGSEKQTNASSSDAKLTTQLSARDRLRLTIPSRSILRDLASPPGPPVANLVGIPYEAPPDSPQILPPTANGSDINLSASDSFHSFPTNFPLSPMVSYSGHSVLTPLPQHSGDSSIAMDTSWVDEIGQAAEASSDEYVNPLFLLSEGNRSDMAVDINKLQLNQNAENGSSGSIASHDKVEWLNKREEQQVPGPELATDIVDNNTGISPAVISTIEAGFITRHVDLDDNHVNTDKVNYDSNPTSLLFKTSVDPLPDMDSNAVPAFVDFTPHEKELVEIFTNSATLNASLDCIEHSNDDSVSNSNLIVAEINSEKFDMHPSDCNEVVQHESEADTKHDDPPAALPQSAMDSSSHAANVTFHSLHSTTDTYLDLDPTLAVAENDVNVTLPEAIEDVAVTATSNEVVPITATSVQHHSDVQCGDNSISASEETSDNDRKQEMEPSSEHVVPKEEEIEIDVL